MDINTDFLDDDTTVVEVHEDSLAARLAARRNTRPDMQIDERFSRVMSIADQVRAVAS